MDNTKKRLFMGIECKTPSSYTAAAKDIDGQLWGITRAKSIRARVKRNIDYLALYTCTTAGETNIADKLMLVSYRSFPTYEEWIEANSPSFDSFPREYGDPFHCVYANVDIECKHRTPLYKAFTGKDFTKLKEKLHKILWGGGSTADNAIFDQLVRVFLVKINDERTTPPEADYAVQVRSNSQGEEADDILLARLNAEYEKAARDLLNYDQKKIAATPFLSGNVTASKVKAVIREIGGISITENLATASGHDFLGEFFEGILTNQSFYKQERGTFFTHQIIVRFILSLLGVDETAKIMLEDKSKPRLPYIIDPSCGSGTFLIEAMKMISSRATSNRNSFKLCKSGIEEFARNFDNKIKPNIWAEDYLYGIEPRPDIGLAAKVNMILHGDGNMNIFIEDGLRRFDYAGYRRIWEKKDHGRLCFQSLADSYGKVLLNEAFDFVVSNPPFSIDTSALESAPTLNQSFIYSDKNASENLFIERYYQLLSEGGHVGVVLPETFFDIDDNAYIRQFVFRHFMVRAVISLPQEAFEPHTKTKTSILIARKRTAAELMKFDDAWKAASKRYSSIRNSRIAKLMILNETDRAELRNIVSRRKLELHLGHNVLFCPAGLAMIDSINSMLDKKDKAYKADIAKLERIRRNAVERSGEAFKDSDAQALSELLDVKIATDELINAAESKYATVIRGVRLDYPNFLNLAPYSNAWWCFREAAKENDYEVFFAQVGEIGFKRFRRSQRSRAYEKHDLYSKVDALGFPLVEVNDASSILDWYSVWKTGGQIDPKKLPDYIKIRRFTDITRARSQACGYRFAADAGIDDNDTLIEVGSMLTLEYGKPLPDVKREPGKVPVVGSNGIIGYHKHAIVKGPCIVIGRKGSAGVVTYYEDDCWPIDTTLYVKLRPNVKWNMKILAIQLKTLGLDSLVLKKAVPGLNRHDVYNLKIEKLSQDKEIALLKCLTDAEKKIRMAEAKYKAALRGLDTILANLSVQR